MGFSYAPWGGGTFYPKGLKAGDWLGYYAKCFDCVELDTTFYAVPDKERVRRWAGAVGEDFRFSVKTPRDVTHAENVGAQAGVMAGFVESVREFGGKLGTVLLQFPPSFEARRWRELEGLVRTIPAEVPVCAEFRHGSWWKWGEGGVETEKLLGDYGMSWASADYVSSPRELRVVGGRGYVRLIGEHDRYPAGNREERDPTEDLRWWIDRVESAGPEIREMWVLHNNDYAGFSIATGERFKRMLGMDVVRPMGVEAGLFG